MKKPYLLTSIFVLIALLGSGCSCNTAGPSGKPQASPIPTTVAEADMSLAELYLGSGEPYQEERGSETYSVVDTLTFANNGTTTSDQIELWYALMTDKDPYQDVLQMNLNPATSARETDSMGNEYAVFSLGSLAAGATRTVTVTYEVQSNEIFNYLGSCQGNTVAEYLQPEQYIESTDPEITALAGQLTMGADNTCTKAIALYEYVAGSLTYTGYNPDHVGAKQALTNKGGDCNEFTDLFVALSRAAGIPARPIDGFTYVQDPEEIGDIKHAWAEIYLPGTGWTQVDPTWGRRENQRSKEFSQTDGRHMIVTEGRNLAPLHGYNYYYYKFLGDPGQVTVEEDLDIQPI